MYIATGVVDTIDFNPPSTLAEVIQNVRTIITTIKGSVPLDRQFGLDNSAVDEAPLVAEAFLTPAIIEAIEENEPRVVVQSVTYKFDEQGSLIPTVTFTPAEGVEL